MSSRSGSFASDVSPSAERSLAIQRRSDELAAELFARGEKLRVQPTSSSGCYMRPACIAVAVPENGYRVSAGDDWEVRARLRSGGSALRAASDSCERIS
jgi:hypothetical protein